MKRATLATLVAGIWISLSEFARNELLFKHHWISAYANLGLHFPSATINNALWGLWSLLFAACIVAALRQMTWVGATALCWTMGFALMWIVVGNLNVLPVGLLPIAIPWSLAEVGLAIAIALAILKTPRPAE